MLCKLTMENICHSVLKGCYRRVRTFLYIVMLILYFYFLFMFTIYSYLINVLSTQLLLFSAPILMFIQFYDLQPLPVGTS